MIVRFDDVGVLVPSFRYRVYERVRELARKSRAVVRGDSAILVSDKPRHCGLVPGVLLVLRFMRACAAVVITSVGRCGTFLMREKSQCNEGR